jgi:His-Xaa-Ser system radical SAM maturase HxsC
MQYLRSQGVAGGLQTTVVGKLTSSPVADRTLRRNYIINARRDDCEGFQADIHDYAGALLSRSASVKNDMSGVPHIHSAPNLDYLSDGDIVALLPSGIVKVLYRRTSPHNSILTTERCNSLCLMCSQPPRPDDDSYRIAIITRMLELVDDDCPELIFSGGEPLLLGDAFFELIDKCKRQLPQTAIHVLTNGRLFENQGLAQRLGAIEHPDLMLGIPLYSDVAGRHDYVVQARGAYVQTINGIYNLAAAAVPIEIRVVVHHQTYKRLPQLAEFVCRNLPFVSQVVLMGMEMYGLVHQNMEALWIDPMDYQEELEAATMTLARSGIRVLLYNHQLCVLRRCLWPFAVKSISDWKNTYLSECESCAVREQCGGFFQSGVKRHSRSIRTLSTTDVPFQNASVM